MVDNANANPHVAKLVLERLAKGPATYADLAKLTGIPTGTIVQNMNVLVKQGLAIREVYPSHRNFRWFFRLPASCKGCEFDVGCPRGPVNCKNKVDKT